MGLVVQVEIDLTELLQRCPLLVPGAEPVGGVGEGFEESPPERVVTATAAERVEGLESQPARVARRWGWPLSRMRRISSGRISSSASAAPASRRWKARR